MDYSLYILEKIREVVEKYANIHEIEEIEVCIPNGSLVDREEIINNFRSLYGIKLIINKDRKCKNIKNIKVMSIIKREK